MENETEKTENAKDVIEQFRSVNPKCLVEVLLGETLNTQKLVISCLPGNRAATILQELPEKNQVAIVEGLFSVEKIQKDLLELTLKSILKKVSELEEKNYVKLGGVDFATSLINFLNRSSERTIMKTLEEKNPQVAEEIKKRMFVFEDIVMLDDRSIQRVLRETDQNDLAKALKNVDPEVQDKIFKNMSKNAMAMLKEEIEYMGPLREIDRDEAQQLIVSIIKRLEEQGDIVIARPGDLDFIV
ncbi:MAG: hypothetical protein K6B43_09545 [Treponema sp.]|nr:hypothetical protein [Treponema sp.]